MTTVDDAWFREAMAFRSLLGMRLAGAGPDEVRGSLDWKPELCTTLSVLHGGALMAFADSLGGVCALLNLRAGEGTSTIESKTNFFRAVRGGTVEGVTRSE